jgi:biopolymer transport protein ExbD
MRSVSRQREPAKLQPPMTPMIDIIFQLLIFFLLTPTFSGDEGYLTTNLPRTSGPNPTEQRDVERIKIELLGQRDGVEIVLNETHAIGDNFEQLEAMLRSFQDRGLAPDYPVLISPTMDVQHKWVVRAFDTAILAQFKNIQFAVPR